MHHAVDSPEASDEEYEEGATHCLYTAYCLYTNPVLQNFREAADKDPLYVKVRQALDSNKCPQELPTAHPVQAYKGVWDRMSISNGLVCIDSQRLLVPGSLQDSILIKAHTPAHQGLQKSKDFLGAKYFFPQMNKKL